jgi:hypothetical protein
MTLHMPRPRVDMTSHSRCQALAWIALLADALLFASPFRVVAAADTEVAVQTPPALFNMSAPSPCACE